MGIIKFVLWAVVVRNTVLFTIDQRRIEDRNLDIYGTPHELATDHWHRMIVATKCRKPMPRVIPVSNNTSKRYEPYATILHRCGEDTGCCGSTASVCTVKRYEVVMVYVFSYDFNYRKEIEALPMQNHTECHCVNRGSLLMHDSMPRGKRSGQHHQVQQWQQRQLLQQQSQQQLPTSTIAHWRRSDILAKLQLQKQQNLMENMLSCHCPQHFNVFEEDVERHAHLPRPHSVFTRKCRCDCLLNNVMCQRFKAGEEAISLEDRKCILEHNCKPPVCLYGDFNSKLGKCPGSTIASSSSSSSSSSSTSSSSSSLQRLEVALN
uniref:Platelet-derived growth factor (PDGF) family profile domain-containing protein n=1 Tax=Glossina palpalis gambiensis TaxID=67801 RepID=A0A1B0BE10_9MUSC